MVQNSSLEDLVPFPIGALTLHLEKKERMVVKADAPSLNSPSFTSGVGIPIKIVGPGYGLEFLIESI